LQIIPASLSSEPFGGVGRGAGGSILLRSTTPSLIKHFGTKVAWRVRAKKGKEMSM